MGFRPGRGVFLNRKSAYASLLLVVIFILAAGGFAYDRISQVDCRSILDNSAADIKQRKFDSVSKNLEKKADKCSTQKIDVKSAKQDKDAIFEYNSALAIASYENGNKDVAKKYAEEALSAQRLLTDEQKSQQQNGDVMRLADVYNGTYKSENYEK